MKDKKGISIVNAFNKIIKQSNRKPNKIWVDQGGEFYNNVFEKWLSDNNIDMYSTYNEGKSVVAERFIRTLKNKLYNIEAQIAGLTKNTVDNLADITKIKAIDTNSFVNKTKFSADINTLDDEIDGVEKKNLI